MLNKCENSSISMFLSEAATGDVLKKDVLKNFEKSTGKHLCWSLFLIKLLKKRLQHRCFPMNFAKLIRTRLLQNTFRNFNMYAKPNFIKIGSNYYKTIAKNQKLTKESFKKNVRTNLAIFDPPPPLPPLPPCTLSYISRRPPPHSYVLRTFFSPSTPTPSLRFHTHIHIHRHLGNLSTYTFRKFIKL